jgi:hypothetical protein
MSSQPPTIPPVQPSVLPAAVAATGAGGDGHYAAYEEHAKTLRTWLAAYGIGAPVLMLSQKAVWEGLERTHSLRQIAILFILGSGLQVALAAINKSAMWACYFGEIEPKYVATWRYKVGLWLSERYIIDFVCDIVTITLFGYATYLMFLKLIP